MHGVHRFSMVANLKVQTGAVYRTTVTHGGNDFAGFDGVPLLLEKLFGMSIYGIVVITMVDDDHVAVPLEPTGIEGRALEYGMHGLTPVGFYIDAAPEINQVETCICIRSVKVYDFTLYRLH